MEELEELERKYATLEKQLQPGNVNEQESPDSDIFIQRKKEDLDKSLNLPIILEDDHEDEDGDKSYRKTTQKGTLKKALKKEYAAQAVRKKIEKVKKKTFKENATDTVKTKKNLQKK